jgi:hypothetical protein
MNVYRVAYAGGKPQEFIIAPDLGTAFDAADDWALAVELLGEVRFAEGVEHLAGGRQVTLEEIRDSMTIDHITSFEDGKQYAVMTRHLKKVGLTPDQYRAKWGLPAEYPMVSVRLAARRSEIAKASRLGGHKRK